LTVFLAIGWSFEWIVILVRPSITLMTNNGPSVAALESMLVHPFLVASTLVSWLWFGMLRAPHPWTGQRARRGWRAFALVWSAAATLSLVLVLAPLWLMGLLLRDFDPTLLWFLWMIPAFPLLPLATGLAALRVRPSPPLHCWRDRTRWLQRFAFTTVISIVVLVPLLGIYQAVQSAPPGAGTASRFLQIAAQVALVMGLIVVPLALSGLSLELLRLIAAAAACNSDTPGVGTSAIHRRAVVAATVGGVAIPAMMLLVLPLSIANADAWGARWPPLGEAVMHLLALDMGPWAVVLGFVAAVVLFWMIACFMPAFIATRSVASALQPEP